MNYENDSFNREAYRQRNIVERLIGWWKEPWRVATRYGKFSCSYLAFIILAAAMQRALELIC